MKNELNAAFEVAVVKQDISWMNEYQYKEWFKKYLTVTIIMAHKTDSSSSFSFFVKKEKSSGYIWDDTIYSK